ncbi:MAG: DUF882 domain-containing protein [Elusimicrobiota bacterium]
MNFFCYFLFFLIASDFSFSQNMFFIGISSTNYKNHAFRDVVRDIDGISQINKIDVENFSPSYLFIKNNVDENDIKEIEESEEFDEISDLFKLIEPKPVNLGGNGNLTIIRKDTREKVSIKYRNKDGSYNQSEMEKAAYVMRCSLDGSKRNIPAMLLEILDAIEDKFGKRPIILLSGYRTKPLNDITPGSAKRSMHLIGWAADIRIEGVSSRKIRDFARKLKAGGVGYYPKLGFVHVDIGKVRYWERYQYSKKRKFYAKKKRARKLSRTPILPKKINLSDLNKRTKI